ncbi:PA domain-containing protein, partial [Colletotrichum scovillei]
MQSPCDHAQPSVTLRFFIASRQKAKRNTCNTRHSPVVSDPTTTLALAGLSRRERTGSRVLQRVWSHVLGSAPGEGQ